MNLILSDRNLNLLELDPNTTAYFDLSQMNIANCVGCFGCWTRTPGKCVIRDDAVQIYPCIARSRRVIYVSRIKYGGYDVPMKTMLERAIPIQQAFIRLFHGETHHIQRAVAPKQAVIFAYGDSSLQEQDIFRQLVERNARNMIFEHYRIVFLPEDQVEQEVGKELKTWKIS